MTDARPLPTFGTILAFACELESGCAARFRELAAVTGPRAAAFARLRDDAARRAAQVERMRRENVNEMILERIEGVAGFDWQALLSAGRHTELEQQCAAFYVDAADKGASVLAEVAGRFRRLAQGNRDHQIWLAEAPAERT